MGSEEVLETPYIAAMNGDWNGMVDFYKNNVLYLLSPVTLSSDTGLHLAVHSNKEKPLTDLLEIMEEIMEDLNFSLTNSTNKFGNTVLHEATIYGNYEAVRLLVERCPVLLFIQNNSGETPLFTAAGFGEAEIVELLFRSKPEQCVDYKHSLLEPEQCVNDEYRLLEIHRQRSGDGLSILSAAIIGQHFETALMLLEVDDSLHDLKDEDGRTALQFLADMPSAFKSGYSMGIFETLFYCCLPVIRHYEVKLQLQTGGQAGQGENRDLESGSGSSLERNQRGGLLNYLKAPSLERNQRSGLLNYLKAPKGCWPARLERFWNQKIKHVFALRLAKILIEKDKSWKNVSKTKEGQTGPPSSQVKQGDQKKGKEQEQGMGGGQTSDVPSVNREERIPLFLATRNGIEEIVWEIIKLHPHAVEKLNDKGQSILDVSVMHRKKKIFSLVKQQKIPLARLHRVLDIEGNTLLHHVADMEHYRGGTKPGPALQLQEELQWFEQVQDVIPFHYATLQNKTGKTAEDLFRENHKDQLEHAQKWIKETTQSCSTVAALVATVVFAAAYTVPGGSDENGTPNFIHSPYFLVFTISDVLSLASSLTSLVVFLSLLTSPFDLKEFHFSLPRKLLVGFTFLFFAVITTMLSFGATILILIQSERKLTTLLLSIAAFLPVLVFAIMQFRLYVSFMGSTVNILKITEKALPPYVFPCLPRGKKLRRAD